VTDHEVPVASILLCIITIMHIAHSQKRGHGSIQDWMIGMDHSGI
jgi:hypothetical protein